MLLDEKNTTKTLMDDTFFANWPTSYYGIPDGPTRLEALKEATKRGITTDDDLYREKILMRRFFSLSKDGSADAFMRGWMMISAGCASQISFFNRKMLTKELLSNMKLLLLHDYNVEDEIEEKVLFEEYRDFAKAYFDSCVDNKIYRSSVFGLIPMKEATLAEKIANEFMAVTKSYPESLGYGEEMLPLHKAVIEIYKENVGNAEEYLGMIKK